MSNEGAGAAPAAVQFERRRWLPSNPLLKPGGLLLVGLSLSIGWGIRGNYGHETGAMFPGALAAVAACLVSAREDWRQRVVYFAFFGMLGWSFGGSISYMMVIGYTQSGHSSTQLFGFIGLFLIGFLWAALGGGGTALPAVMDNERLKLFFRPLSCVLAAWCILYFVDEPLMQGVQRWLELDGIPTPMQRQESALYWLDSDWFQVLAILSVLLLFDLCQRRFDHWYLLPTCAAVGAAMSFLLFLVLDITVGTAWLWNLLVQYQGMAAGDWTPEHLAVTNWPPLFLHFASHSRWYFAGDTLALLLGAGVGVAVYFYRYGRFAWDAGLLLWMALGWLAAFLLLPVLGSLLLGPWGGLRMTPPRGDNWAGILGTLFGAAVYLWRHSLRGVLVAAIICGAVGGVAFCSAAWLEAMLVAAGNPHMSADPDVQSLWSQWQQTNWLASGQTMRLPEFVGQLPVDSRWAHWQQQNWHSFLEQTYGFGNGIGVALALAYLCARAERSGARDSLPVWTEQLAIVFAFPILVYANLIKNVREWTQASGGTQAVPDRMKAPWLDVELTAWQWFSLFFLIATLALVGLLWAHRRRPLAVIPSTWLGRGQMFFLLLMWVMVLGNLGRALPHFSAGRLLTEGTLFVNAVLATVLVLIVPGGSRELHRADDGYFRGALGALVVTLVLAAVVPVLQWHAVRRVYGNAHVGKRGMDFRFGPNANWRRVPLLKGQQHR